MDVQSSCHDLVVHETRMSALNLVSLMESVKDFFSSDLLRPRLPYGAGCLVGTMVTGVFHKMLLKFWNPGIGEKYFSKMPICRGFFDDDLHFFVCEDSLMHANHINSYYQKTAKKISWLQKRYSLPSQLNSQVILPRNGSPNLSSNLVLFYPANC